MRMLALTHTHAHAVMLALTHSSVALTCALDPSTRPLGPIPPASVAPSPPALLTKPPRRFCGLTQQSGGWTVWREYASLPLPVQRRIDLTNGPKVLGVIRSRWPDARVIAVRYALSDLPLALRGRTTDPHARTAPSRRLLALTPARARARFLRTGTRLSWAPAISKRRASRCPRCDVCPWRPTRNRPAWRGEQDLRWLLTGRRGAARPLSPSPLPPRPFHPSQPSLPHPTPLTLPFIWVRVGF